MVQGVEDLQEELMYKESRIEELEALNEELKERIDTAFKESKVQQEDMNNSLAYMRQAKESQEKENRSLEEQIKELVIQKKEQEQKNAYLQKQIDELLTTMKASEKHIDKAQNNSTITEMSIEPKMYLKGMFDSFIKEKNALKILIEGREYFYPLETYQCTHLPISGSRVLIFKSEDGANLVYGFHVSKLIDSAQKVKATVKFVSSLQNRLKLHIENYGFINFEPAQELWDTMEFKIGETLILSEVHIDGDIYFYITHKDMSATNRNEILKILLKETA